MISPCPRAENLLLVYYYGLLVCNTKQLSNRICQCTNCWFRNSSSTNTQKLASTLKKKLLTLFTRNISHIIIYTDPSKELWFCGQQFTAADITLCVLMGRLDLLGLSERYHSKNKRLRLHQYWLQAKKRPTINRVVVNVRKEMMKQRLKKNAMTALPLIGGLVALGLAAGLAFVFAQKR